MKLAKWSALCFALLGSIALEASATVADEAQFFDGVGRRAYEQRSYQKALEAFLLVHEIAPSPRSLYNIAICADLAGHEDVAFAHYRQYLASDDPDAVRRKEAVTRARRLESKLALLEIRSEPSGAEVHVDRKELGQYGRTPTTIVVGGGAHELVLELAGHEPVVVPFNAEVGRTVQLSSTLKPRLGEVEVTVTPVRAELQFLRDERPVRFEFVKGRYRLPVGSYTVVATAPGYAPARTRAVVHEGEATQLTVGLAPLPRATGRLLVSAGGMPAEVFLDGRRVAVAPVTLPAVEAGTHVLELRLRSRVVRRQIQVTAARATHLEIPPRQFFE
jgi:hypothetical protein